MSIVINKMIIIAEREGRVGFRYMNYDNDELGET